MIQPDRLGLSTIYSSPQNCVNVLVQFVPGRTAMLITRSTPPGLWIHIMGTESAPTSLARYVYRSWGAYWIAAHNAAETPRKVAQRSSCFGVPVRKRSTVVKTAKILKSLYERPYRKKKVTKRTDVQERPKPVERPYASRQFLHSFAHAERVQARSRHQQKCT